VFPTFIIVLLLSKAVNKFNSHPVMRGLLYGIRPVVVSLILLAAIFVGKTVLISATGFMGLDWISILIAGAAFIGVYKFKLHPILLIVLAAISGVILY